MLCSAFGSTGPVHDTVPENLQGLDVRAGSGVLNEDLKRKNSCPQNGVRSLFSLSVQVSALTQCSESVIGFEHKEEEVKRLLISFLSLCATAYSGSL